jgi:elongator complex protein 6
MVNADSALVSRSRTRLEMEESSFVTTLAHQASSVTSLRMLDTGLAKDVSGVLRVTMAFDTSSPDRQNGQDWNEKEVLYFVKDGSVEVFNRGQMRT